MKINKYFFRILFYPLGLIKVIYRLGLNGSRDILNNIRFNNVKINSNVCIDDQSKLAAHVNILKNCVINNSFINSYTYVGKNSIIQNASIGKFCSIGSEVCIGLGGHPISNFSTSPIFYRQNNILEIKLVNEDLEFKEYEPIEIGHDVWIGTRAIILDGVIIGTGAIIAANAVVTKDVPPYAIVGGSPANLIRYRFDESKIQSLLNSEWWELDLIEIIKKNYNVTN